MKMNLTNIETGLQRLYYLAVVGFYGTSIYVAVHHLKDHAYPTTPEYLALGAAIVLAYAVAPWIVMKVIQWIYRGFVPKPE